MGCHVLTKQSIFSHLYMISPKFQMSLVVFSQFNFKNNVTHHNSRLLLLFLFFINAHYEKIKKNHLMLSFESGYKFPSDFALKGLIYISLYKCIHKYQM